MRAHMKTAKNRTPKMRDLSTVHRYVDDPWFRQVVDLIALPMRLRFENHVRIAHGGVIPPTLQLEWDEMLLTCADIFLNIEEHERARCVEEVFATFPDESSRESVVATVIAEHLMSKIRRGSLACLGTAPNLSGQDFDVEAVRTALRKEGQP